MLKSKTLLTAAFFLLSYQNASPGGSSQKKIPPEAVPRYTIRVLGKVPFVAEEVSLGLNDTGDATGWKETADHTVQPVLWKARKEIVLPLPAGNRCAITRALNPKGQAVGWASDSANLVDSQAAVLAVLFDGDKAQDLGTLGGKISQGLGLNAAGTAVGVSTLANGQRRAFRWQNGKMTALENLPGGNFSAAYAVNEKGLVAGAATQRNGTRRAVLWQNGKIIDIGTLPDGESASARAINNRGDVVGFSSVHGDTRAFLWRAGKMTDLGDFGSDPTAASDINELRQIVGSSAIPKGPRHAFLWQDGKMTDLTDRLPAESGWMLLEAHRINHRGQIVGIGLDRNRQRHALLLTPVPIQ